MADAVIPVMVLLIGVVIAAYVAFVRWRMRVHRERADKMPALPDAAETRARLLDSQQRDRMPPPADVPAALRPDPSPESTRPAASVDVDDLPKSPRPPTVPGPDATPAATMADAVSNISLPDTLSPYVDAAPRPCRERAAFQYAGADPVQLRDTLGPVFEAIGYTVEWDGLFARATRGATELDLEIYANALSATIAGQPLFPTAGPGAIVVDIWLP